MAVHKDTPVKNHSDHFIESLSASQRNHLRVLLHSERGMTNLRISLNIHRVQAMTEDDFAVAR